MSKAILGVKQFLRMRQYEYFNINLAIVGAFAKLRDGGLPVYIEWGGVKVWELKKGEDAEWSLNRLLQMRKISEIPEKKRR